MGFPRPLQVLRRGALGTPLAGILIDDAERVAQSATPPNGAAELLRQLTEQVLGPQVAPGARDLVKQNLGMREMLEQGGDVGKSFVKRQHVGIARLGEPRVEPIEQRVGHLVGNHVVG